MTVPETVMHDSRNQTGRNISASDETKSDVSEEAPDIKITAFYGKRMKKNCRSMPDCSGSAFCNYALFLRYRQNTYGSYSLYILSRLQPDQLLCGIHQTRAVRGAYRAYERRAAACAFHNADLGLIAYIHSLSVSEPDDQAEYKAAVYSCHPSFAFAHSHAERTELHSH